VRILLTRPREDSEAFAARLAENGIETMIAPLMTVVYDGGPALDLDGIQAVLLTSANGVRALARRTAVRDLPVLAVGDATAREAREAGFTTVESAGGDVDDLARLVGERCDPGMGGLLHVAGSAVAGDLAGALAEQGFDCRREPCYHIETVTELPPETVKALAEGAIDGVALFSPRSAATFMRLASEAGLDETLSRTEGFALSANVAAVLAGGPCKSVHVAAKPTADDLLEVVLAAARTR